MSALLFHLPSIAGTLLGLGIAWVAATRRPGRGWGFMVALGVSVAWWCVGQSLWLMADTVGQALRVNRIQYVAILLTPVFWFWLALAQTGRRHWLAFPRYLLFLVVPAWVIFVAVRYDPGESSLWLDLRMPPEVPAPLTTYGPLFYFMALIDYALFIGGCVLLIGRYIQSPHYRFQLFATGVIPIGLVSLNAMFISGNWPLPVDPTPLALAVGCALLLWALLRHRLLDLAPVGRGAAFDSLNEGVLILDERERVVDANASACRLLERLPRETLGLRLDDLLPGVDVARAIAGCSEQRLVSAAGQVRHLQPEAAPIRESHAALNGTVVTLRDTTREHQAQLALREARERLERANEDLDRMAHTDALTGLANRRLLLARLEEEVARARRSGAPLAMLMIDLDHFKQVNDRHGHLAGDAVLEATGALLRGLKRPSDVAARYGGEELSLLLADTAEPGARAAATRVRMALRELTHRDPEGIVFRVTASVGVALLSPEDTDGAALIDRADEALYAAKSAGRDCVCVAMPAGFEVVDDRAAELLIGNSPLG